MIIKNLYNIINISKYLIIIIGIGISSLSYSSSDSLRVQQLIKQSNTLLETDLEQAKDFAEKAVNISNQQAYTLGEIKALRQIGKIQRYQKSYTLAIEYYQKSLDLSKEANLKYWIAYNHLDISEMYQYSDNRNLAVAHYLKAIPLLKELDEKEQLAHTLNNVAYNYLYWGNHEKIISYYTQALSIYYELEDTMSIAMVTANLGFAYHSHGDYDSCFYYHQKAMTIYQAKGSVSGMAKEYHGYGDYYLGIQKADSAIKYFELAAQNRNAGGETFAAIQSQMRLGEALALKGQFTKALEYQNKALDAINKSNNTRWRIHAYKSIYKTYQLMKDYQKSFGYLSLYQQLKDSSYSAQVHNQIAEMQVIFDTKEKEKKIGLLKKDNEMAQQQLGYQYKLLITSILIGLLILVTFMVLYRNYRIKKKSHTLLEKKNSEIENKNELLHNQNEEIVTQRDSIFQQKEKIEEIHLELTQSIDYAERLQASILPEKEIIESVLDDHFVVFKPKDKVSGDFYWWCKIEDTLIIVVADCTGHGVPGAFMSMLGVSLLREIVMREYMVRPDIILRKLRKEIVNALKQTGKEGTQKDGMDMSLISINTKDNTIDWAGAYNPIWILRANRAIDPKGDTANLIEEVKGDKMPIAYHDKMDKFTSHSLELNKGDKVFLFTDGFPDQFGGPKGKKYKYKPFKRLLVESSSGSMEEQAAIIEKEFNDWINYNGTQHEQVDDVTLMGLQF